MRAASDTSAAAREVQIEAFRVMGPTQRAALAFEMSEEARAITAAGVRARHPEWAAADVDNALVAVLLGPQLATIVLRRHAR